MKVCYGNHSGSMNIYSGEIIFYGIVYSSIFHAIDNLNKIDLECKIIENLFETSSL